MSKMKVTETEREREFYRLRRRKMRRIFYYENRGKIFKKY